MIQIDFSGIRKELFSLSKRGDAENKIFKAQFMYPQSMETIRGT